jgi:hypothetical protein
MMTMSPQPFLSTLTSAFGGFDTIATIGLAVIVPLTGYSLCKELADLPPLDPPALRAPIEATDPQRDVDKKSFILQLKEHLDYLKEVSSKGDHPLITAATAVEARKAWWVVWEATGFALPIPAACTGPDGQMLYSWDNNEHHLELEIILGQPSEIFYKNRVTMYLWGESYNVGDPLPAAALEKLKLFI